MRRAGIREVDCQALDAAGAEALATDRRDRGARRGPSRPWRWSSRQAGALRPGLAEQRQLLELGRDGVVQRYS